MGMFDEIVIEGGFHPDVSAGSRWQTKSLDCGMDTYKIDTDGQLWREEYDTEDRSDPNAEGLMRLAGICTRLTSSPPSRKGIPKNRRLTPLLVLGVDASPGRCGRPDLASRAVSLHVLRPRVPRRE